MHIEYAFQVMLPQVFTSAVAYCMKLSNTNAAFLAFHEPTMQLWPFKLSHHSGISLFHVFSYSGIDR